MPDTGIAGRFCDRCGDDDRARRASVHPEQSRQKQRELRHVGDDHQEREHRNDDAGAILRLAACFAVPVDVIEPCGFPFDDRRLRRLAANPISTDRKSPASA